MHLECWNVQVIEGCRMDLNIALKLLIELDSSVLCEGKGSDGILLGGLL